MSDTTRSPGRLATGIDRAEEWAALRERHLRPAGERPASSARGVHHVALMSSDVERTIAFYQDLLEFPLTELFENRDYEGSTHFFFDIGNGNALAFFDFPGLDLGGYGEVLGGLHHLAISVPPDRWTHLRAKLDDAGIGLRAGRRPFDLLPGPGRRAHRADLRPARRDGRPSRRLTPAVPERPESPSSKAARARTEEANVGLLDGRVALVTGGARGQGAAEARLFADEGATVVLADVLDEVGEQTAAGIADASYRHLDVTSEEDWQAVVDDIVETHGRFDVLMNNAGIFKGAQLVKTDTDLWNRMLAVNQTGVFFGMRAGAKAMIAAGNGGSIINTSSIAGTTGVFGSTAYGATKWAVRGMTKVAAKELGRHGIRVNSIHPGVHRDRHDRRPARHLRSGAAGPDHAVHPRRPVRHRRRHRRHGPVPGQRHVELLQRPRVRRGRRSVELNGPALALALGPAAAGRRRRHTPPLASTVRTHRRRRGTHDDTHHRRLPLRRDVPVGVPGVAVDARRPRPARPDGPLAVLQPRGGEPSGGQEAPVGAGLVVRLVDDAHRGPPAP